MNDATPPMAMRPSDRLLLFFADIKISHTIFAMPWALLATFMAADGWPGAKVFIMIVLCMITARTVAMAANRLLDARLDSLNPRTAGRAIPSGKLTRRFYWAMLGLCSIAFIGTTSLFWIVQQNPWPLILSIPVLLFISAYPLLKRFTQLCHYYLGAALALAPVCAWIAVEPKLAASPFLIAAAVLLWTAGFDIIYACQDYRSDIETGVISVPARLGIPGALWVSRITHLLSIIAMVLVGVVSDQLGGIYFAGVACAATLLIVEHWLVWRGDLSKVGLAFFTVNGFISVLVGLLGIVDVLAG